MSAVLRASGLLRFPQLVTSLGGDPDALLDEFGIDRDVVGHYEDLISYTAVSRLLGAAAERLDCPDFGMRLARWQGTEVLGPLAVLVRHSATVGDALEGTTRYLHNCAPADVIELRREPAGARFTFAIDVRQLPHRPQMVEKGLVTALSVLRLMLGPGWNPLGVAFEHRRVGPPEAYRVAFGCPVAFDEDANALRLGGEVLDRPIHGRDAAALRLAEDHLSPVRPDDDFAEHVRETTRKLLLADGADLVGTAGALALHPRVVQRRLAAAGTTFEAVLDEVRRETAWQLAATGMQAAQIARTLGYSEQSSYSRACRRWFGESPRELAARRRSPVASA